MHAVRPRTILLHGRHVRLYVSAAVLRYVYSFLLLANGVASTMGTGARAPLASNNFIFLVNFRAAQSLAANMFVFCDSSCGSSVAFTHGPCSVLFRVILCVTLSH